MGMTERTERVVLVGLLVLRVGQYGPGGLAVLGGDWGVYSQPRLVIALYVLAVMWSGVVMTTAFRRGALPMPPAVAEVALLGACTVVVGRLCEGQSAVGWANWTVGPLHGAALIAVLYLHRGVAAGSVVLLGVSYLTGLGSRAVENAEALRGAFGNTMMLWTFTVAGALFVRLLRRQAQATDTAYAQALKAETQRTATQTRYDERTRQYRMLHDTVLSTLTAIARGGLDNDSEEVRERCRTDADYLRALIAATPSKAVPATLAVELADVGRRAAGLGLRVHQQSDDLPSDMPQEVVDALAGAAAEALNNTAKHAGVRQAYLTAFGDGQRATVVVSDQGRGFDPAGYPRDRGIDRSIRSRMDAVGGQADITSAPGEGTSVELTWQQT
ncbi:sensor histidine kinase [Streptomyces adelaidensis]|jgi:signal transduction histidine kinase|uniref:sensor histidine kinase n=1 Tax=Streptomyces adelaidensis TaxID=2796465 RepID=UPI001905FC0B|nr:hypothetical protein [Streptomyces adelaidensis]